MNFPSFLLPHPNFLEIYSWLQIQDEHENNKSVDFKTSVWVMGFNWFANRCILILFTFCTASQLFWKQTDAFNNLPSLISLRPCWAVQNAPTETLLQLFTNCFFQLNNLLSHGVRTHPTVASPSHSSRRHPKPCWWSPSRARWRISAAGFLPSCAEPYFTTFNSHIFPVKDLRFWTVSNPLRRRSLCHSSCRGCASLKSSAKWGRRRT